MSKQRASSGLESLTLSGRPGTARGSTSPSSPRTQRRSSSASSTRRARERSSASRCGSAPTRKWHCYLPYGRLGQLYGYRVYGPYDPERATASTPTSCCSTPTPRPRSVSWTGATLTSGYRLGAEEEDLSFDERDNAAGMPKCRVVETAFTWGDDDRPPRIPWHDTIIYETHVKGFTQRHPDIPPALRGTYAGLASAPAIDHLKRLGVTAVELMPVHLFVDDKHLVDRGSGTTGATTPSASSRPTCATRPRAASASSRRWSRGCTRLASR